MTFFWIRTLFSGFRQTIFICRSRRGRVIEDQNNRIFVSAVVCWEITTKYQLGKLVVVADVANEIERAVLRSGLNVLPITFPHAQKTGSLPYHHKDPFDRLLIAQAMVEGMILVSNDAIFDRYGVDRIW